MLRIRHLHSPLDQPVITLKPGEVGAGLHEDNDYLIETGYPGARVFIDDVELSAEGPSAFRWRPEFYAGRVIAEVLHSDTDSDRYLLDVSPSQSKSGQDEFDAMVAEIRSFDQSLLSGTSSAKTAFGREGCSGHYQLDVLLSRVRSYGPAFLGAVEVIVRSPHRSLAAVTRVLPLSRIRRLHHTALSDRRIAAIASGKALLAESIDSLRIHSSGSSPTFDTPANQALKALLRRFAASVSMLSEVVQRHGLGAPKEEQIARRGRRLIDLSALEDRARRLLLGSLFREVSSVEPSAAGLTQISAQPTYSKSYRLGCRALATQIEGGDPDDQLHVPPSWGIYETWCFLCVVGCTEKVVGSRPVQHQGHAATADRAVRFNLSNGEWIEVLFQATFPSLKVTASRLARSLSKERRPDIVLVRHGRTGARAMIFDAKWRSGSNNVLDAMGSAHIYHDALRLGDVSLVPCMILLPGTSSVPALEEDEFIHANGVGAVSSVRMATEGVNRIRELVSGWIDCSL